MSSHLFALPFRYPVICPLLAFVTFLNIASGRPLYFHSFSCVSAKADIRKRKITNDTSSPCLTPTSWSISAFSLPIFTMTLRLVLLSTAKAEYISMSHTLCETILVQNLVKEINCIFDIPNPITDFCITCHEDNLSAIAMAESSKFTPIFEEEGRHLSTIQVTSRSNTF
jgi:hypothetical protein